MDDLLYDRLYSLFIQALSPDSLKLGKEALGAVKRLLVHRFVGVSNDQSQVPIRSCSGGDAMTRDAAENLRAPGCERMEDHGGNAAAACEEDVIEEHKGNAAAACEGDVMESNWQAVFERTLSFGNRDSGPEMDSTIWQSLPEDVEDKVLAWLPITTCTRFKSVCKRWLHLINSTRFAQMHSSNGAPETWVLSFSPHFKHKGQVFDPVTTKTFILEFPFLPENTAPVATSGGLVCFCCESGDNDVSFYLCNPVTKAWKCIPSPCSKVGTVTLVVEDSSYYKLYVFCEASAVRWLWGGTLDHSTKEYDSKSGAWREVGGVHSGEQFKPGSVFSNGNVHLLTSETVEILDVKSCTWWETPAPAYASCATLLERNGRLLVVGDMVHHNVFHLPHIRSYVGVVVWELDFQAWSEVTRMPEALVDRFSYSSFSCVVVGDLLYLFSRSSSVPCTMVYSFARREWSRVGNWSEVAPSKVLSFCPRLDACA